MIIPQSTASVEFAGAGMAPGPFGLMPPGSAVLTLQHPTLSSLLHFLRKITSHAQESVYNIDSTS